MRTFFLQLRSLGAPRLAARRSPARSRSPPPNADNGENCNGPCGSRETIANAGGESASAALRSRNPRDPHHYRHNGGGRHGGAADSSAQRHAAAPPPPYVIRPLPWMSPTSYSSSGAIDAGKYTGGGRSYHNQGGGGATSYLWAGHYSQTSTNGVGRHPRTYHPRAGARSSLGMTMRRCRRRLPPGAVALLGGLTVCSSIALLYIAVSWIVRSVLYARDGDNYYDGAYYGGHRFYHQPEPLDGLKFQEWTVRGTSASADLDRDLERAHRLELLRRPTRQRHDEGAAAASGKAEEEEESFRSYMDHRRNVLERIVPKWLHRNDAVKSPSTDREMSGGDRSGNHQGDTAEAAEAGIPSEARQLEKGSLDGKDERPMITLSNMDQHKGNSCPMDNSADVVRTTLVLQASPDRMWILNETCRRWRDPIVVVVGMVNATATAPAEEAMASPTSWNRTLHGLRLACPHLTLLEHDITNDPVLYPVNRLRNLALDAVTTSHVLVMDADFVPSTNLNEKIRNVLQSQRNNMATHDDNDDYAALVVPAFERVDRPPCLTPLECRSHLLHNSSYLPQTFEELQSCVKDKNCQVFQLENNWPGHYSTRSGEWLQRQWYEDADADADATNNKTAVQLRRIPCFHSLRYEPYVVISWCGGGATTTSAEKTDPTPPRAPYYDERFYGYGKNKIEYLQHLRLLGYKFEILPEGFLVHNPHVDSRAKLDWNAHKSSLHRDMDQLYPRFLQELLDHPSMDHTRPIVGLCSDDKDKKKKKSQEEA